MILNKACNLGIVEIPREIPSKFIGITPFKHYRQITYMPLICLCHYYCNFLFWYNIKLTENSHN